MWLINVIVMESLQSKLQNNFVKLLTKLNSSRNVVKAYYTAGLLCEVLQQFGPLSEEIEEKGKISKYRATYIHNMLKQGLPPQRINVTVVDSDEQEAEHMLTHDEINERRKQRGEDPLPPRETSSEDIPFMMPNVEQVHI